MAESRLGLETYKVRLERLTVPGNSEVLEKQKASKPKKAYTDWLYQQAMGQLKGSKLQ